MSILDKLINKKTFNRITLTDTGIAYVESTEAVESQNKMRILAYLSENGDASSNEIAENTGIDINTVKNKVNQMLKERLVRMVTKNGE